MWLFDHLDPQLSHHLVTLALAAAMGGLVSVGRFAVVALVDRRLPRRLGSCALCLVGAGCAILSAAVAFAACCLSVDRLGALYSIGLSVGVAIGFDALSAKAAREFSLLALKTATKFLDSQDASTPSNDEPP